MKGYVFIIPIGILIGSFASFLYFKAFYSFLLAIFFPIWGSTFFATLLSLVLYKKFPDIWKKTSKRLYCVGLFLISYAIGWHIIGLSHLPYLVGKTGFELVITALKVLLLSFFIGIVALGPFFIPSIPIILFAYLFTKDITNLVKRVLIMLLFIIFTLWPVGLLLPGLS